jgi:UPF0176 protein
LQDPEVVRKALEEEAGRLGIIGLMIIGVEGFNSTVACDSEANLAQFKEFICTYFRTPGLCFKDSFADRKPFRKFKVKIRREIVTLATPELIPDSPVNHHLSPTEWNKVLREEDDFLLIDTRNWYETKIGTFKGAVNPGINKFTEFPAFVEKNNIPKDKKILIFCTGGIRCEKGILEMQEQGFENVYQLDGGILNYLKEYPDAEFEGECFVFDHRVSVTQSLRPSARYGLCPHCGQPAEITINCGCCGTSARICDACQPQEWKSSTCSKDCAYRLMMKAKKKFKLNAVPRPASPATSTHP